MKNSLDGPRKDRQLPVGRCRDAAGTLVAVMAVEAEAAVALLASSAVVAKGDDRIAYHHFHFRHTDPDRGVWAQAAEADCALAVACYGDTRGVAGGCKCHKGRNSISPAAGDDGNLHHRRRGDHGSDHDLVVVGDDFELQ